MIDKHDKHLGLSRQCALLMVNRSRYYHRPIPESAESLRLMRLIDEQHMKTPFYGSRRMTHYLQRLGYNVCRKRVARLMRLMNIQVIYQRPKTSTPGHNHRIYPYLLRGLTIDRPNQVWCTDITYIPMQRGFMYMAGIMDWQSRKLLSFRISNSMDSALCLEALEEALELYGKPEMFNSDQGSQFTSAEFTAALQAAEIQISMDGKGRWMDNVFIERFWRSLKYECIYLQEFAGGNELKTTVRNWVTFYNQQRPHQSFDGQTPDEVYCEGQITGKMGSRKEKRNLAA